MARIKYFNQETGKWEYADVAIGGKGEKGDKPVLGVDYFTEADKTEMVNSVIAALPKYTGSVS